MKVSASLGKLSQDAESPVGFRNSQNTLRDYFNKVIREKCFIETQGIQEGDYNETENCLGFTEHLYSEGDDIVMTRIPRGQVEFALQMWRGVPKDTPIIRDEWDECAVTAEECIRFFEYSLKETDAASEYDDRITLIWE